MSVYSMSGPTYSPLSKTDLLDSALSQPLSLTSTLYEEGKGGALESFGLGTVLRQNEVPLPAPSNEAPYGFDPSGLPVPQGISLQDYLQGNWVTPDMIAKKRQEMGALTEDQYKQSPSYRKDIPYDPGMTETRAAALASMDDAKKVREFYAQKRPLAAFLGSMAGQALDPINYIPVGGPLVKAAAIGRFGRIGGEALTAGLDAAANTAVFGVGTAGVRAQFGDDVSWQGLVSQIATAGLIGSAFGTVAGAIGRRMEAHVAEAEQRLATLQTTQEARIALNEGIDAIVRGEDVNLSPNATEPLGRIADQINPARSNDLFAPLERADLYRSTAVGRVIDSRPLPLQDFESAVRNEALASSPDLNARYQAAEAKFKQAQDAVAAIEEPIAARRQSDSVALVDPASADRLRAIEDELAASPNAKRAQALQAERDMIVQSVGEPAIAKAENDFRIGPTKQAKQARKSLATARQEFSKVRREADAIAGQNATVNKLRSLVSVDTTKPKPEPVPEGRQQAEVAVAKPEDAKALAAQYGVDANNGAFKEEADVAQLADEGRLTEQDVATMAQAHMDYEVADAYAEALKSVAGCLI
ncbi:hypothetical protein EN816_00855 [Mesorhizobium sp. M8A.F.Ca.ET.173.01.1.1]|nr:hypothetical protein EN816_00855 [Mesorhizobium sp. M8A.F.Ca.ET.173.01.1.1]